ncbi:MFS transporter [Kribbella sandramycini]|uniref:MFS transporter n=1 Tax=Kribbella sandramycini TaxID=60450 RepID=A0A7Y4L2S5_9ACTN|nr:putative MFS family arabinose efflux permease [Kribbella sandramycini]NOL43252.1 MFS transporter [Kribbella sandramycini]
MPLTYFSAATLARLGDEMVAFTLVLLVLERTGSSALAGLTGAAYALPAVLSGPFLGAWLDGTAYRRTALAVNQGVLVVVMLALLADGPAWTTPLLAAVAGVTLPMVSGGFTSMLPSLVAPARLPRANSLEAASYSTATIAGPALAATLTAVLSVEASVITIAVTATVSIVAISRLPRLPAGTPEPLLGSVATVLRHLARTPQLRASTTTTTLLAAAMGMLLITLPIHMASLNAPESAAGYLWTALEVGSVCTALLLPRFRPARRPEYLVIATTAAVGVALGFWPLAGSLTVLLVLALLTGAIEGPLLPAMFAARQQYSPLTLQGRVGTTAASLRVGAGAVGQVGAGLLLAATGSSLALLGVAAALLIAAAAGLAALRQGDLARV